jgi:hypothetical protein
LTIKQIKPSALTVLSGFRRAIANIRAGPSQEEILAEIKAHLIGKGRKVAESDNVLWTHYCSILDRLNKVAKERGEKLPKSAIKELSLCYMNVWAALNEQGFSLAFSLALDQGMEVYRTEGLQALLQFAEAEFSPL